jgi:hypothetical protein
MPVMAVKDFRDLRADLDGLAAARVSRWERRAG